MRVTIEHREVLSILGRRRFFVDCTVQFSEAERAVITNRQLGDNFVETDSDLPRYRSINGYIAANTILWLIFVLTGVAIIPTLAIFSIFNIHGGWWVLIVVACIGTYVYRKQMERRHKKSQEPQCITVTKLMKNGKFTACEPDAYLAQQTEKNILAQLNNLKSKLIAVAPGLAEKQVYARG